MLVNFIFDHGCVVVGQCVILDSNVIIVCGIHHYIVPGAEPMLFWTGSTFN